MFVRINKKIIHIVLLLTLLATSCKEAEKKPDYEIDDKTYSSKYKGHRIRYIVVHYTYLNDVDSIETLTKDKVSTHYLITTDYNEPIYRLVDENERAWHAGISYFDGRTALNDSSIGIEIVHKGRIDGEADGGKKLTKEEKAFPPHDTYVEYDKKQLKKLVFLLKDITKRYDIHPRNIIAHADIAPTRKQDPGPKFPWKWLYDEHNIGIWYDTNDYAYFMTNNNYSNMDIIDIKKEFYDYGYTSMPTNKEWDKASRKVLYAFQCHFRPSKTDGNIDMETYVVVKALNKKLKYLADEALFMQTNNTTNK